MRNAFCGTPRRGPFWSLLVVLAATVVSAGCSAGVPASDAAPPSHRAAADGRPVPVAIIGDSLTAGTDAGGLDGANWTAIMARKATAAGLPLQLAVSAHSGSGYLTAGGEGTTFLSEARRIVTADDRVVIVFGSCNDNADVTAVAEATFSAIERNAPNAKVIAISPPPRGSAVSPNLARLGIEIRMAAARKNVTFVDSVRDGWFCDRVDLIGADGWHPNDAGHRYLADKITPLVLAAIRG